MEKFRINDIGTLEIRMFKDRIQFSTTPDHQEVIAEMSKENALRIVCKIGVWANDYASENGLALCSVINSLGRELENIQKEKEAFLQVCGSCKNFVSLMGEMGLCKLKETCFCKKKTDGVVDIFDKKCGRWELNPNCL